MNTVEDVFGFVSEFNRTFKENLDAETSDNTVFFYEINRHGNNMVDSITIEAGFKKEADAYTYLKYLNTLPEDQWRLGSLRGLIKHSGSSYGVRWYMR